MSELLTLVILFIAAFAIGWKRKEETFLEY